MLVLPLCYVYNESEIWGSGKEVHMLILQILILVALVKVLIETENALLCAGIYTGLSALISLLFGESFQGVVIGAAITFAYVYVYFWLLSRFIDGGLMFWLILIGGLLAPFVLSIALAAIAGSQ